jgi:uncharacterized protein (TIGR03437 family)
VGLHTGIFTSFRQTLTCGLGVLCLLLGAGVSAHAQGDVDAHTLLLLRFENSLVGEQGEAPTLNSGTTFESGILGQGLLVDGGDILRYAFAGNFNMPEGTIEFWVKPRWSGNDNQHRAFFSAGPNSFSNDLILHKDGASNFRFVIGSENSEANQGYSFHEWNANEWHHIAVTWTVPGRMITYIDGVERINHPSISADTLSPLPDDLYIGTRNSSEQANCVIDELRISNVARTPQEIEARRFSAVTVNSVSVNVVTRNLWKTWRVTPQVTASANTGTFNVPANEITWSSSNPGVATVNSAGQIVGVGAGSAVLTAQVNGVRGTINISVNAPLIEPRVNIVSGSLAKPAAGALYEVPVVIFRYLPTADGVNLDTAWSPDFYSLNPIPLSELEHNMDLYDPILKFMLEEGSRFRDYGNHTTSPSLGYRVVAIITVYEPTPPGKVTRFKPDPKTNRNLPMYDADWFQIFERFGMQDYVNKLGVKEVWFYWGGVQPEIPSYDPAIHPPENMREGWESNMSSPTTTDISNSNRDNTDLPVYNKTYIVYGRNDRRLDMGTIHVEGHQLEQMFSYVNRLQTGNDDFFWQKFVGVANNSWQRGRCGDTHHPPNAQQDYDYQNFTPFDSDIMDWKPDGGQTKPFSAATLQNTPYQFPNDYLGTSPIEPSWYTFWRQSMPGRGNTIPFGANRMTNWWQFVGDWDAALRAGIGLYEPNGCTYSLSTNGQNFTSGGGTGSVSVATGAGCRWMATSNAPWLNLTSGDTGNNGNTKVNFSIAPNTGGLRAATVVVAGQLFTVTQAPGLGPALMTEDTSPRALALDSVTFLRDPFSTATSLNFSSDHRSRIMLFAANAGLMPGEDISAVTAQAEDSQHRVFPLTVEFVGQVPNFEWLTQINVRLPDELANAGDVRVSISLRGVTSNQALISISPSQ